MLIVLHILLIVLTAIGTASAVALNWGPLRRPCGTVLVASLPILALGVLSALLLSAKGAPMVEWVLPLLALLIAGLCCRSDKVFKALRWGLTGIAVLLWLNFGFLVGGGGGYTAKPDHTRQFATMIQSSEINAAGEAMRAKLPPDATYPAGPVGAILDDSRFDAVDALAVRPEWHTPLTRLYREVHARAPLWYPGGEIASASQKLEARTR